MIKKILTIINKLGLHARAASKLSDLATRFQCRIHIQHRGRNLDVKDILSVLVLGASQGTELTFEFEGPQEIEACDAIEKLILERFGEEE